MTTDFQTLSGALHNNEHQLPVRIYWEDTDGGGIVYHANYLKFMERGRTDFLRVLGIHQMQFLEETGISIVVGKMDIAFKRPAQLDDVVMIKTRLVGMGGATITLAQSIWRDDVLLIEAHVVVATVKEGRPTRLPAALKEAFAHCCPTE